MTTNNLIIANGPNARVGRAKAVFGQLTARDTTPTRISPIPYLKIVRDEPFTAYNLGQHFWGWHSIALAPGSPALPAGMTLTSAGVLSGTATVAAMNQTPVIRVTNAVSGLSSDHALLVSVAQRPGDLPAPALTELTSTSFRITKPTLPANTPAITSIDILRGPTLPLSTSTGTLVFNAYPGGNTTFDVTVSQAGSTRHVALRAKVLWGDGTTLNALNFSPNVASITLTGANTAPAYQQQPSISPASGPVGTVFSFTGGTVSGQPTPTNTLIGLTQNGTDVFASVVNGQFTSTEAGPLVATWQAVNGVAPNATAQATAQVNTVSQAPAQMAEPTLTVISASQIDATLAAAPNDGGSTITSYELRYSLDQQNWTVIAGLVAGETRALLGLLASTVYYVQTAARNTISLGPWSPSKMAMTNAASGTTLQFGQYTAIGAGGVDTLETAGTYGQFTVAAGKITPNASPLAVGVHTVGATTINVASNEYSVASLAEFAAAKTHMGTAGGRTIRFRPGTYAAGVDYTLASAAYASMATITAESGALFTGNFKFSASNCTLRGLDLQCLDSAKSYVLWMSGACTNSVITQNRIHAVHYDPLGDYSVNVLNNPRGISNTSPYLNGCTITRNEIFDVSECIVLQIEGGAAVNISDNEGYWHFSDFLKMVYRPGSFNCMKVIERNYGHDGIGDPNDANNPHIDAIQFTAYVDNHMQPLTNVFIRQNIFTFTTKSRGWGDQGLVAFQDGVHQCLLKDPVICGNVVQSQNYSMVWVLDGGIIANNTMVSAPSANNVAKFNSAFIRPNVAVVAGGAAPQVFRNIWEDAFTFPASVVLADNLVIGDKGAITSYASLFTGTDLEADTLAEVTTEFSAKAGGPALATAFGIGAVGTGVMTIGSPRDPSGWTYNAAFEQLNPGVVQALSLTELPYDGYVFSTFDNTTASVIFRGKGTTGQTIQARGASAGGNTAWGSGVVDAAGNWTVTLAVPMAGLSANWYTPEARIGTDDLTKVTGTKQFGCGKKIIFTGQSELDILLSDNTFYGTGYTYPTPLQLNLTTILQTSNGPVRTKKITTFANGSVNISLAALSNTLAYRLPGWKWEFIDGATPSKSLANLQNSHEDETVSTAMRFSDYKAAVDLAESGGSPVTLNVLCWYNSTAGTIKEFGKNWSPFFIGELWSGGAFTLGATNPEATASPAIGSPVDHCLWDKPAWPGKGRGLFTPQTKLAVVNPMPFMDAPDLSSTPGAVEATNFTSTGGRVTQHDRPARDNMIDVFCADPRIAQIAYPASSAHIVDFTNDIHPKDQGAIWGLPQFGHCFLPAILINCGIPIYEGRMEPATTAGDGSYADVPVTLPNGGTLTTLRAFASLPDPTVIPPQYQPLIGFEVRRLGQTDAQRRSLFQLTETSYPATHRGTSVIQNTGTGSGAARRGTVRVTPEVPFVTGDMLEYLRGQASALLLRPRDGDAHLFKNMPIEHIPSLYDATQPYPYYGVPIRPQPPLMTLTIGTGGATAPSAFTAGQWTLVNKATNGALTLTLTALPANGGATITDVQYQIGAGNWISLGSTALAAYTISGLTNGVSASVKIRAVNSAGASAASDTKSATPTGDSTAPTLTTPTDAPNGSTGATGTVSTDDGSGTLYVVATTSATAPSAAQVKAGQDHLGAAASAATSKAVTASGNQTVTLSGLSPTTTYYLHYMQEDLVPNPSLVVSGDGFITTAAATDATPLQSVTLMSEYNSTGKTGWTGSASITIGSSPNRALVLQFFGVDISGSASNTTTPTLTATFNGQPVDIFEYRYHPTDRSWMAYGYLPAPPSGAGTVALTTSTNQSSMCVQATEVDSAHQVTKPVSVGNSSATSGATITANGTTTQPGSLLMGGASMTRRSGLPSADLSVTGGTLLGVGHSGGATDLKTGYFASAYKLKPTAGADNVIFTLPESGVRWCWETIEVFRAP